MITKKEIFQKAGIALVCGIGFGIPFWGIYAVCNNLFHSRKSYSVEEVVISSHEMIERGYSRVVLGVLKNEGKNKSSTVNLEVRLYDSNDRFVEKCRERYWGGISAGETLNFRVNCNGSEESPLPQFERYEIDILP